MAERTAKVLIADNQWADYWICEQVFQQAAPNIPVLHKVRTWVLRGEHGTFSRGVGTCIICGIGKQACA